MENAITAAPEVSKVEALKVEEKREGGFFHANETFVLLFLFKRQQVSAILTPPVGVQPQT